MFAKKGACKFENWKSVFLLGRSELVYFFSVGRVERLGRAPRREGGERRKEAAGAIVERSRRESRGHGRGRESEIRE